MQTKRNKSAIQGFLDQDENNRELVIVWLKVYEKYEDALRSFAAKFKQLYKAQVKKTYKNKAKVNLRSMLEEYASYSSAITNGRRVLDEATNKASQRLILRLKRPAMVQFDKMKMIQVMTNEQKSSI